MADRYARPRHDVTRYPAARSTKPTHQPTLARPTHVWAERCARAIGHNQALHPLRYCEIKIRSCLNGHKVGVALTVGRRGSFARADRRFRPGVMG
jgi:hypothetical protein